MKIRYMHKIERSEFKRPGDWCRDYFFPNTYESGMLYSDFSRLGPAIQNIEI